MEVRRALPSVKRQMVGLYLLRPDGARRLWYLIRRVAVDAAPVIRYLTIRLCSFIPCLPESRFWPVNVLASLQPEGANRDEWP